jgi:hypothetical protein
LASLSNLLRLESREDWYRERPKNGKLIATIPVRATGDEMNLKTFSKAVKNVSGHHDVFIKFPTGKEGTIYIYISNP